MRTIPHWIGGAPKHGGAEVIDVTNPATDQPIATVAMADPEIVESAVAAAEAALGGWSATPLSRRANVLYRFRDLLLDNKSELAALITAEHGKTVDDAAGEIARAADSVELACGGPVLIRGGTSLQSGPNIDTKSVLHPLGVCVGITPFNFPAMMGMMMAAVAIAAGNTFVWKPSEQDPGVCVRIAELLKQAGFQTAY